MMKKSYIVAVLTAIMTLFSCIKAEIAVETISLGGSEFYVEVGGTTTINAVVVPETAMESSLQWTSDNPEVATVNDGVVTALREGSAVITVTAESGVSASCTVRVTPVITGIHLPAALTVAVGGSTVLTPAFSPETAGSSSLEWKSEDESIARVDQKGVVTGVNGGRTVVTVRYKEFTASCQIKVREAAAGVELDIKETTLEFGKDGLQLTAIVEPSNSLDYDIDWTSSDEDVAVVSPEGFVTPVGPGEAQITVTIDRIHQAVCLVRVVKTAVEGVALDKKTETLRLGEQTLLLNAVVTPSDASDQRLKWTSSDEEVAVVSPEGLVTPVGPGEVRITVTTVDGGYTDECLVTVVQPVISLTLNETSINISPNMMFELLAQINPSNATNKELRWESSDETVAVVDQYGVVRGVDAGTDGREAVISVTSVDSGVSATCVVSVTRDVVGVGLDCTYKRVEVGMDFQLTATILPVEATNKNVVWTSSDDAVATVDENGKVTAKAAGTAVITVTTMQNGYKASCRVQVRPVGSSDNEGFEDEDDFGWN